MYTQTNVYEHILFLFASDVQVDVDCWWLGTNSNCVLFFFEFWIEEPKTIVGWKKNDGGKVERWSAEGELHCEI